jgi:twitching motility protein PilT
MHFGVEELLGQIAQHQLMAPKDLEAMRSRWFRPGRREVDDSARFCAWLRVNDYLTEFVLAALAGKADRLTLNQYRLTDLLRDGPQAGDFLATDPLDRLLRVQVVAPALAGDAAWLDRFRQAVRRAMNVQHAGVARVLDFGHASGIHYLVSEYAPGESLEDLLKKRGTLNYDLAARVFALVFDAVAALHQSGVRIAELNSGCLVFTSSGKSAGGVRTVRLVNVAFPRAYFDATALGIGGTALAPDGQGPGRFDSGFDLDAPPQPDEDLFRLGCLFYRCLAGHEPYPSGPSPRGGWTIVPVRQAAPDVPALLAELIDSLIDPTPSNRPKSAAAAAKALRVFLRTEEDQKQTQEEEPIAVVVQSPTSVEDGSGPDQQQSLPVDRIAVGDKDEHPATSEGPAPAAAQYEPEIERLFRAVVKFEGSDLHLAVGSPPLMRVRNAIRPLDLPPLTAGGMEQLIGPILTERARAQMEASGGADFAHVVGDGQGRFRVNLFRQRGHLGLVARRVNSSIPTFEKLGLPPVLEKLCTFEQGMVILAGVTGSGKSTTLAAMIDYINERERLHILTIEDPIEYLFTNKKAVINQREVGIDVADWHVALKHAVRQDPDVILVGEMRDRETFEAGIHAAETGHLVFCTIHASTAPSTIGRILDLFPADMHSAMRQSLAFNLKAVVCQKLVPSIRPGVQRVPTNEIMIVNPTIRELIVRAEDKKLPDALRIGMVEGMLDFNESLHQLVTRGDIDAAAALEASPQPESLKMALKGIRVAQPGIL